MVDASGALRVGDWQLVEPISRGGFGTVWRARGVDGWTAAVKILHPELAATDELVGRFAREAEAMRSLCHPNVVECLDHGVTDDGRPYLVMELLEGRDLGAAIRERGALPVAEALDIAGDIAGALEAAHALGIIHRDIKPSNVMLCDGGGRRRVVLLDFGLAKLLESDGPQLTASRMTFGTPSCMAPEQVRGDTVDCRTDVYSLGALLYEMLTGAAPFAGASIVTIGYMHLHGRRPRPGAKVPVPPAIDDAVVRAMAREPGDRFATVAEFRAALDGRPPAPAGELLAARIELAADGLDDPDDELLDDVEDTWQRVERSLAAGGFATVVARGNTWVFARPLAAGVERAGEVAEAIALLAEVRDRSACGEVELGVAAAAMRAGEDVDRFLARCVETDLAKVAAALA